MLPDPVPRSWAELQKKAQRAKNTAELIPIIDEMNKMLDEETSKYAKVEPKSEVVQGETRKRFSY
jgi:hypothetical protein